VGVEGRSWFSTIVAPFLGAVLNILMLFGVAYYDLFTQGPSYTRDTAIALGFAVAWLVIGFAYLYLRKVIGGVPILHAEDHKEKAKESLPIGA